jgi:translation initiation factor 4G
MERVSSEVRDESVKAQDGTLVAGGALFRKYLLNRCQEDYENGWKNKEAATAAAKSKEADDKAKQDANEAAKKEAEESGTKEEDQKEAELLSDEYYAAQKAKRRGLGLVRFIGELYRLQMLTERIMHECIKKLLSNTENPEEEDVESLCRLLTTVGKGLDNPKAKQHMDIYFSRMNLIANSPKVSSRIRFMILVSFVSLCLPCVAASI